MSFNIQVKECVSAYRSSSDHKTYIKCEDVTQLTNANTHLSCVWIPQCIHISSRGHHVTLYWNI